MSTWVYRSDTGELTHDGYIVCIGYSGSEQGKNSPEYEAIHDIGPIPRGTWRIGKPYTHAKLGPITLNLSPVDFDAFGRTDFRIHGDNATHTASHGCVILNQVARKAIAFDVLDNVEPVYLEVV